MFFDVYINETVKLEKCTEYLIQGRVDVKDVIIKNAHFVPNMDKLAAIGIFGACSLVDVNKELIPIRLYNISNESVTLYSSTVVGRIEIGNLFKESDSSNEYIRIVEYNKSLENKDAIPNVIAHIEDNTTLSNYEKSQVKTLIRKYANVFSSNESDIGLCRRVKHEIITKPVTPVHIPSRRVPLGFEDRVDTAIDELLNNNIIRPSESPWNAPLVVVQKKNGNLRLCVDYRGLNAVTLRPIYPIPETKQLLDTLSGSQFFSALDLSSAYYQMEVEEADRHKTAFTTRRGQFEFNRMPFGLCGAPATFQRMMHIVLQSENWLQCLIYLDDVLVFAKDFNEHLQRLESILQKLLEAGIKLSPTKCTLFSQKLTFLGHVVSKNGIFPDPEKIEKVKNWSKPNTIEELRSFLGFANYYRRFIKNYSELTTPLETMMKCSAQGNIYLKKKKRLEWNSDSDHCFNVLKEKLVTPPILSYPTPSGEWVLDTDASHNGMGAVLSQIQNGKETVIEYASKKFTNSELRYCVTRKELLAVYTFTKQFHHYLLGRYFKIRTDHKALTWMLNWDKPNTSQYCKWIAELEQYHFEIEHRPGKLHVNADALSRLFECEQCDLSHDEPQKKRNTKLIEHIRMTKCDNQHGNDSTLLWKYHTELGHIGIEKMKLLMIAEGISWKGINKNIEYTVNNCIHCAERKQGHTSASNQLKICATRPFQKIMIDITGPLTPSSKYGYRYILSIVDVFSRYPMLICLQDTSSCNIINNIFKRWISIFGYPECIISDNAPNLHSNLVRDFCTKYQIEKLTSSPYYPQGNGIVERLFRTIKDRIYATCRSFGIDWYDSIPFVEMGLRATQCKSTGCTPYEILFGSRMHLPWNDAIHRGIPHKNLSQYVLNLDTLLNKVRKDVIKINESTVDKEMNRKYAKGDYVMVKSMKGNGLLKVKFFGPCEILEILSNKSYLLKYGFKLFRRHEKHLKIYKGTSLGNDKATSIASSEVRVFEPNTSWPENEISPYRLESEQQHPPENITNGSNQDRYPVRNRTQAVRFGHT